MAFEFQHLLKNPITTNHLKSMWKHKEVLIIYKLFLNNLTVQKVAKTNRKKFLKNHLWSNFNKNKNHFRYWWWSKFQSGPMNHEIRHWISQRPTFRIKKLHQKPPKKKRIFQKLNEEKSSDSSERFAEEVRKSDRKTALRSSNGLKEQIFSIDLKDSIQRS